MVRQKKQTTKKEKETNSDSPKSNELPKIFEDEFRRAQYRFLFNVEQIEQKYCRSTSGLVMNLKNEEIEVEFEREFCMAENDDELIEMINQQQNNCIRSYIGDAQLSTPAPDPEQRDKNKIKKWKQLNRNFEANYEKIMKKGGEILGKKPKEFDIEDGEENANPESQKCCTAFVKYEERLAAPPAAGIQMNVALGASTNLAMFNGLQSIGANISQQEKDKEEERELKNLTKLKIDLMANKADRPAISNSFVKDYLSPKKSQSPFPLGGSIGRLVPFITIPETPLPKLSDWELQKKGKALRIRTTSNDEVVEQTPPKKLCRTLFSSQFNTGAATPMNNKRKLGSMQLTIADSVKLYRKRKKPNRDFMVN